MFGLLGQEDEGLLASAVTDVERVELVGEAGAEDGIVDAGTVDAGRECDFEVEPELVGGVFEFAADEVLGGEGAVVVFDDEVRDQVGAAQGIDFAARSFFEGDFLAGEITEGGLEVISENA